MAGGSFEEGFTKGAIKGVTSAAIGQFTGPPPLINFSYEIPISDDFSLTVSPSITFGTSSSSLGLNIIGNYDVGDWTFSASLTGSYYSKAVGTGNSGIGGVYSGGVDYDDGKTGFSLYSTYYTNVDGVGKQRIGGLGFRSGDFRFRYENDGTPFGGNLGDGGDSYRTAAVSIGIGDFSAGFNIFTGKRDYSGENTTPITDYSNGKYYPRGYVNEVGTPYRLGAGYFGYKNYKFGINSERYISYPIQARFAHGLSPQGGFRVIDYSTRPYFQYQTKNPFSLW